MSSPHPAAVADRKALLATRAQLDRTRLTIALHDIKVIVRPTPSATRGAALRPTAAMIVGFAAPLFGWRRLARWVRFTSAALTVYRIVRNWRG